METPDNVQTLAIHKVVSDDAYKAASKQVSEGEYDIDVILRLVGKVRKGSDYIREIENMPAFLAAIRENIGEERFDRIRNSIPKLSTICNGKVGFSGIIEVVR